MTTTLNNPARILAADIGGTSSRFAAFSLDVLGNLRLQGSTWLKTGEAQTFGELLKNLAQSGFELQPETADICVFAVAGPVQRGVFCAPPLIKWTVDLSNAEGDFGIRRFALINDFLAQAYACRSEIGRNAAPILSGTVVEDAAVAVIGAGTGLGKAILLPDGEGHYVGGSSEGGHINFCAETEQEFKFHQFMVARLGGNYATFNDIVSGRGLSAIHEFLTGKKLDPQQVASRFADEPETLKWAATFYGRVCRNFALETLCFGGMYIAGGVAAKNPILIKHPAFAAAFRDSRMHGKVLEQIPVFLIDNEESGLWGAGFLGAQQLQRKASHG
ncbi:MAG: glucokinase [Bdellovibrionota bacterium]